MYDCTYCNLPITGAIVVVGDGTVSSDEELEIINTEHFHPDCFIPGAFK